MNISGGHVMRVMLIFSGLLIGALSMPASALAQEKVRIPWTAGWVKQFSDEQASGELEARLYKPAGGARAPFAVFMHGCGGDLQRASHWAKFFTQRGVGFLMVDSRATRSIKDPCQSPPPGWVRRRADDAASALAWLATQPYVMPDRIAIMGQSQGGASALLALNEGTAGADGFVAGLAMYPGCLPAINAKIRLAKPVLVMTGSEDTATPVADCEALRAAQPDKSKLEIIVYPGAAHEFDNPVKPYLLLGKFKAGEHPASRAMAQARVAEWIDKVLKR